MYENENNTQNVQDIDSIRGHPVANYQRSAFHRDNSWKETAR